MTAPRDDAYSAQVGVVMRAGRIGPATASFALALDAATFAGSATSAFTPPATQILLTGPNGGPPLTASTLFTVSVNGALSGNVLVNFSDSGAGGTFTPSSLTLTSGAPSGTFTYTPPAGAATRVLTLTNGGGLTVPAAWNYAVSVPVAAGTWEYLTVGPHSRRVISLQGTGGGVFDASKAAAVDVQAPVTVHSVPIRAFSATIHGEPGVFYLCGGLHSNYQGNEIDRIQLPRPGFQECTVTISHQPQMPPQGPESGYASGSGGYVYRQFGAPMADPSLWQPYPGHQWTKQLWHPQWGFASLTAYAQQNGAVTDANGYPIPSLSDIGNAAGWNRRQMALVYYDFAAGKYTARTKNDPPDPNAGDAYKWAYFGASGMSDWSEYLQGHYGLDTVAYQTYFSFVQSDGTRAYKGVTSRIGGYDHTGGNGLLVRELEQGHFLILRMSGNGTFNARTGLVLFGYNYGANKNFFAENAEDRFISLTLPASEFTDIGTDVDALTFCVDKNSRRVFWMVFPNPGVNIRFYVSTFEDLMNWTRINFNNELQVTPGPYQDSYLAADRQPMHFWNGYLYVNTKAAIVGASPPAGVNDGYINGGCTFIRVKVDAGEDLPVFDFQRFDYAQQGFMFSWPGAGQTVGISKHANWAFRTVDQTYYHNAGDCGISFTQSRAKCKLNDGTARGYTFTELMAETNAVPQALNTALPGYAEGYWHRPIAPDDGFFVYCGATNSNPELVDKFIWVRGGDGAGFSSNVATRPVYAPYADNPTNWNGGSDTGSPSAIAKMRADGWTDTRFLLFDATYNAFKEVDTAVWAYDSGGEPLQHPSTMGSAASRCGAWDPVRNTLWRFVDYGNTLTLCGYNFDTQTVKLLKVNVWVDPNNGDSFSNLWFCGQEQPYSPADEAAIIDLPGVGPKFGWYDASAGRRRTAAGHQWAHKEMWLNPADGKLYIVSPCTGYLWCYETRGPVTTSRGGGNTIPFYPLPNRIPLVGTYPTTDSREFYPPKKPWEAGWRVGADTKMNSFLAPFKGGLLWWSSVHHEGGTFGRPLYAFWRRLGYVGDWTVVTMPREFAANAFAPESLAANNSALMCISSAGTHDDLPGPRRYFWRIT